MIVTMKFTRLCVSFAAFLCAVMSTPILSMENNDREDSGLSILHDGSFEARVVEVLTGDMIKVQRTGSLSYSVEQIRLDGVRAPKMDTCFGLSACKFLEHMILDRDVIIKNCIDSFNEVSCSNEIQAKISLDGIYVNDVLVSKGIVWTKPIEGLVDGEGGAPLDRIGRRTSFRMEYPKHPIKRVCSQEQFLNQECHK